MLYMASLSPSPESAKAVNCLNSSAPDGVFLGTAAWPQPRAESGATPSGRSEDEALMTRLQAGDEAALGQLLDRHSRLVLGIGYRILRDAGEAQELVQDVFLHAYRKCRLFDPQRGPFRAWLSASPVAGH